MSAIDPSEEAVVADEENVMREKVCFHSFSCCALLHRACARVYAIVVHVMRGRLW